MENFTELQAILIDIYNEFKAGVSIAELADRHKVTNTEMFHLVQMGKKICQ